MSEVKQEQAAEAPAESKVEKPLVLYWVEGPVSKSGKDKITGDLFHGGRALVSDPEKLRYYRGQAGVSLRRADVEAPAEAEAALSFFKGRKPVELTADEQKTFILVWSAFEAWNAKREAEPKEQPAKRGKAARALAVAPEPANESEADAERSAASEAAKAEAEAIETPKAPNADTEAAAKLEAAKTDAPASPPSRPVPSSAKLGRIAGRGAKR